MSVLKLGVGVVVIDEVKPKRAVLRTVIDASLPTVLIVHASVRALKEVRVEGQESRPK
jgi:hypothetical protein